jgi:glutathione S-transferase
VLEEHMNDRQFVVGDGVSVADFVLAYTLDWANETHMLDGFTQLEVLSGEEVRPDACTARIAEALASINS